jgi:hypothetical protein
MASSQAIILTALLLSISFCAQASQVSLRLGPEGDILAWLVAGPLPNPGQPHATCMGFDKDYLTELGGEETAAPAEGVSLGEVGENRVWRLALATQERGLDLLHHCWSPGPAVAYAYATVVSDREQDVRVLLGSDDGVKLWVNGKLCHENHTQRGVTRDEDSVTVRLIAGENRVLFKVDQGHGGWGLMARLTDPDGAPVSGLTLRLDVLEKPAHPQPAAYELIRAVRDKPGSLDVQAAVHYELWHTRADRWVTRVREHAEGPEKLEEVLQYTDQSVQAALSSDADRASDAMAKAAKAIEKDYDRARARMLRDFQNPASLFDVDPAKEDFIRIAPGGRYFVHADGRPFIPLGYNHNPDWPQLVEAYPGFEVYAPAITDRFFVRLRDSGVNLVRMMIETPPSGSIENPIGTFRPEHVIWLDNVFQSATKAGVKLMVTPWDTFWMNMMWEVCPYNHELGGPVVNKIDFITNREIIEGQKKRLKYMIDRWGNSGTVFAWELLNEGDIWWGASAEQLAAWTEEMAAYVRQYQKERWGRNHLVTTSTAHPMPGGGMGDLAYRRADLDFATTHLYIGSSKAPTEPFGPAFDIHQGVTFSLRAIQDNRPYFDSENGPIDRWIADEELDNEVFHAMSWAHLASGGAGSGLRWPYRGPHHLTDGMYRTLSIMSKFVEGVPWSKVCDGPVVLPEVTVPEAWLGFASGSSEAAICWVAARSWESPTEVTFVLNWPDGPEQVAYRTFNTRTGEWLGSGTAVASDGKVSITISEAPDSIAVLLEKEP